MKIQLENWKVLKVNFSAKTDISKDENSFDLSTGHFFPEDEVKSFGVGFEIEIIDQNFDLFVHAIFMFSLDEEITEEFKLSNFPKINAPAIAFPYLRAYISNLTLQSGYSPIMLPSINFVKAAKDKEDS
ncbi:protein-export chaperone SecB [Cyclobacterium marinum]|uniref:Protein export chaperone SecB n=1 Tax=Cyclobacterium marinum (strain ATCC 25205 / DSM 745 / LMG 13164 / NCIMB 1802) TaxID=880070 RepID=G0IZN5_CYCMS|nr:protein-export chaperone SecB [Cyclobacterium marinum]AEL25699.1 protein export chaperone SecB [Cyclobacterium marinum DSM 745]